MFFVPSEVNRPLQQKASASESDTYPSKSAVNREAIYRYILQPFDMNDMYSTLSML